MATPVPVILVMQKMDTATLLPVKAFHPHHHQPHSPPSYEPQQIPLYGKYAHTIAHSPGGPRFPCDFVPLPQSMTLRNWQHSHSENGQGFLTPRVVQLQIHTLKWHRFIGMNTFVQHHGSYHSFISLGFDNMKQSSYLIGLFLMIVNLQSKDFSIVIGCGCFGILLSILLQMNVTNNECDGTWGWEDMTTRESWKTNNIAVCVNIGSDSVIFTLCLSSLCYEIEQKYSVEQEAAKSYKIIEKNTHNLIISSSGLFSFLVKWDWSGYCCQHFFSSVARNAVHVSTSLIVALRWVLILIK